VHSSHIGEKVKQNILKGLFDRPACTQGPFQEGPFCEQKQKVFIITKLEQIKWKITKVFLDYIYSALVLCEIPARGNAVSWMSRTV
jgi:hypothetical protein